MMKRNIIIAVMVFRLSFLFLTTFVGQNEKLPNWNKQKSKNRATD